MEKTRHRKICVRTKSNKTVANRNNVGKKSQLNSSQLQLAICCCFFAVHKTSIGTNIHTTNESILPSSFTHTLCHFRFPFYLYFAYPKNWMDYVFFSSSWYVYWTRQQVKIYTILFHVSFARFLSLSLYSISSIQHDCKKKSMAHDENWVKKLSHKHPQTIR